MPNLLRLYHAIVFCSRFQQVNFCENVLFASSVRLGVSITDAIKKAIIDQNNVRVFIFSPLKRSLYNPEADCVGWYEHGCIQKFLSPPILSVNPDAFLHYAYGQERLYDVSHWRDQQSSALSGSEHLCSAFSSFYRLGCGPLVPWQWN